MESLCRACKYAVSLLNSRFCYMVYLVIAFSSTSVFDDEGPEFGEVDGGHYGSNARGNTVLVSTTPPAMLPLPL